MALSDYGMFLPSESHYTRPGAYDEMLQAEAQKRASYLSQMDMFYEELDESIRQFNETLGFKREALEKELEFGRWKTEYEGELESRKLDIYESLGERELDIESRKTSLAAGTTRLGRPSEGEMWDWYRKQYEAKTSAASETPRFLTTPGGSHTEAARSGASESSWEVDWWNKEGSWDLY